MIIKELDPFFAYDKFSAAGRKAEEQMAFYLRRFFGKSAEVDVINGLRIELGGEVAQMDHLLLHPYGLLIVESKSVSGSVQIKNDGQWIRWFAKQPSGMRSPVTQAKMQSMLLKELLEKGVKQKGFFDQVRFDVLVAISDMGTIQWPDSGSLPEVCKADQVAERLIQRIDQFRRVRKEPDLLDTERRKKIATFLNMLHKPSPMQHAISEPPAPPLTPKAVPQTSTQTDQKAGSLPATQCRHCGARKIELLYGKFGYYFQCKACERNTALKFDCPACTQEGRIRKEGKNFFAECRACPASEAYFTNP